MCLPNQLVRITGRYVSDTTVPNVQFTLAVFEVLDVMSCKFKFFHFFKNVLCLPVIKFQVKKNWISCGKFNLFDQRFLFSPCFADDAWIFDCQSHGAFSSFCMVGFCLQNKFVTLNFDKI